MAKVQRVSLDALVELAKQLDEAELENLIVRLHALQIQRKTKVLDADESTLLDKINNGGMPTELRQRYRQLIKKRRLGNLTDEEHQELLELVDVSENYQVERVAALIELARIRKVSLDQLMESLGIKPPPVE